MACLAHRSGLVDGEGDGAGVLTDVPRALWARHLERAGRDPALVRTDRFAVGHLFVPPDADRHTIPAILARHGVAIALTRQDETEASALGPRGRTEAPRFLQLALLLRPGARVASRDGGPGPPLAADRERDQADEPAGAGRVRPGARGARAARAGSGGDPVARRRHLRLRRRRARPAAALARRDPGRARIRERTGLHPARALRRRPRAARARRARRARAPRRQLALPRPGRRACAVRPDASRPRRGRGRPARAPRLRRALAGAADRRAPRGSPRAAAAVGGRG